MIYDSCYLSSGYRHVLVVSIRHILSQKYTSRELTVLEYHVRPTV